jgi:SAM-dependent methyltransferase
MSRPVALRFDPQREEDELRSYLGNAYDRGRLERYQEALDEEAKSAADERDFYRTSQAYLYNLTAFAMTGTKLPYLDILTSLVPPGSRILDYGCGIGSDGLMLLEAGYKIEFADFNNPSTTYLKWRLKQRSIDAPVHDIESHVPGGFDAAFSFDVIEHVPDPYAFLHEMESRARLVEVNFLEFDPNEQELHHELPIGRLLRYAASHRMRIYRVLHGTSHLVAYQAERATAVGRVANVARVATARARRYARGRATTTA